MVERAVVREVTEVSANVAMVYVGCNLPNGVELQLYEKKDSPEMTPQGPRTVQKAFKKGAARWLKGAALRFGVFPDYPIYSGYAVTAIPKEFWDTWCEQYADSPLIENRCLLAGASLAEVQAKAAAAKTDKVRSGLEAIDPKKPPSVGGGLRVTPADGTKLAMQ